MFYFAFNLHSNHRRHMWKLGSVHLLWHFSKKCHTPFLQDSAGLTTNNQLEVGLIFLQEQNIKEENKLVSVRDCVWTVCGLWCVDYGVWIVVCRVWCVDCV